MNSPMHDADARRNDPTRCVIAPLRAPAEPRVVHDPNDDREAEIADEQQAADAHAHRETDRDGCFDREVARDVWKLSDEPEEKVEAPCVARRERKVLGVVEHVAVVDARRGHHDRGEESDAWSPKHAAEPTRARDAQDPDHRAVEMYSLELPRERPNPPTEDRRRSVETTAVEVVDAVGERAVILEPRPVEPVDVVPVRDVVRLVPRHPVVPEREPRDHNQQQHDRKAGAVVQSLAPRRNGRRRGRHLRSERLAPPRGSLCCPHAAKLNGRHGEVRPRCQSRDPCARGRGRAPQGM